MIYPVVSKLSVELGLWNLIQFQIHGCKMNNRIADIKVFKYKYREPKWRDSKYQHNHPFHNHSHVYVQRIPIYFFLSVTSAPIRYWTITSLTVFVLMVASLYLIRFICVFSDCLTSYIINFRMYQNQQPMALGGLMGSMLYSQQQHLQAQG